MLVPLFGVHYTVFVGMQGAIGFHEAVEVVWLFGDQLFACIQVSPSFCLLTITIPNDLGCCSGFPGGCALLPVEW